MCGIPWKKRKATTRESTKAAVGRIKNGDLPNFRSIPERSNFRKRNEKRIRKEMKKMWNVGKKALNGIRMFPNVAQKKNMKKITITIKDLNDAEFAMKRQHLPSSHRKRKKIKNERHNEIFLISKTLISIAVHYGCSLFGYGTRYYSC